MREFTTSHRDSAIRRGLAFIYTTACEPANFYSYGSAYLCCFYCISATSRDSELRRMARAWDENVRASGGENVARFPVKPMLTLLLNSSSVAMPPIDWASVTMP